MMPVISAFVFGVVFALGLGVAGMTQPAKIIGFLDVAGNWDPALLFVMAGAVGLSGLLFPRILTRSAPLLSSRFRVPQRHSLDVRLWSGAALFGIGWGLSGYCPGPALVSLATGSDSVVVFLFAMVIGLLLGRER